MNNLYNELSNQHLVHQQNQNDTNFGILGQLSQFAQNFKGDPKAQVEQLLKTGKITQQDYQNAINQANAIYSLFGRK